jgi:predicted AAA+ superfamily ATPase
VSLSYWRLASGIEVDFVLGDMAVAVEAKASATVRSDHLSGLRHLHADHPHARRLVVCLEPKRRRTDDGIEVLPAAAFADDLAAIVGRRSA